jgi:ATP-dependent Clp protease ATP-binding subunit ClpB
MHLADRLCERVVGQEAAIKVVAQAVLRSRAGLDDASQPIGSFLFLRLTGVGKAELAKVLAEQLFDSDKMLIRFDMTEFVGTHSVLRLIGAPPRYHFILYQNVQVFLSCLSNLCNLCKLNFDL